MARGTLPLAFLFIGMAACGAKGDREIDGRVLAATLPRTPAAEPPRASLPSSHSGWTAEEGVISGDPSEAGTATAAPGPCGNAPIGAPPSQVESGGPVGNAPAVVAAMASGFRRCYQCGLAADPTMKGSMRITAQIGPHGEVLSASPTGGEGLSGTVTSCVTAVVASRRFDAPEEGGAKIVIPVSFTPQ